jgi:hypothetical protein
MVLDPWGKEYCLYCSFKVCLMQKVMRQRRFKLNLHLFLKPEQGMLLCFEVAALYLAGLLCVKMRKKTWTVVFRCASFRAMHFELVMSLSTFSFLQEFRRSMIRHGRPHVIYSQNGTNVIGTGNLLRLCWLEEDNYIGCRKFNPPAAARWGGWRECVILMKLCFVHSCPSLNCDNKICILHYISYQFWQVYFNCCIIV